MKKYVKVNRTEANKQVDSGHISLTQQLKVNSLPRTQFNKDKRNWTDFKYRIIKSSIAKGEYDKLFNQNSMQIDKIIKEAPLDFLTPRPNDAIHRPATTEPGRKKSSAREASRLADTKGNSTNRDRKNSRSVKSRSGGSIPRPEPPKEPSLAPELEIKLQEVEKEEKVEIPEVRLENLKTRNLKPSDLLKSKVKTIMNLFKLQPHLHNEEVQSKIASIGRGPQNSLNPHANDKSPSSRFSGSRLGPDPFNQLKSGLRPSNSIALSSGSNAADRSFRDDGAKSKPSPGQKRPIMNELLPNREKRNSLKSVTVQQVDSDTLKESSAHSEHNIDTKIVILHTEEKGEKSLRAQQSQRILNQSFISRQKLGNIKPKSGIVNEIEENSQYRNVSPAHQFIRSFFASLNFVLRSPLFGAFKKLRNYQTDTTKPSVMLKLKKQNSMELAVHNQPLETIFGPSLSRSRRARPNSQSIIEESVQEERRMSMRKEGSLFGKLFPADPKPQAPAPKQAPAAGPVPRMSIKNIK